eukprot:UN15893
MTHSFSKCKAKNFRGVRGFVTQSFFKEIFARVSRSMNIIFKVQSKKLSRFRGSMTHSFFKVTKTKINFGVSRACDTFIFQSAKYKKFRGGVAGFTIN